MLRPSLLGLSGALRLDSLNRRRINEAARLFAPSSFTVADLDLPLYNGDNETATSAPPAVQRLADQIAAADVGVISTPEYNGSLSSVLKNALDRVSRTKGTPWQDKPVAIMSAAGGRVGGTRAQAALHLCLTPFRPHFLTSPEVAVAGAANEFDDNGHLCARYKKTLMGLMQALRAAAIKPV